MKKTMYGHLLSVALVGSLLLSGCEKEKTGFLRLNAERLTSNEKTYVDGTTVQWWVGDTVRVNGTEYELVENGTVSGNTTFEGDLLAIYPSSIGTAQALSNNQVAVTIPSEYTYETVVIENSTKQILAMPMVGVAEGSATSMTMKHLCSAMQINVNNGFDDGLVLDSIILRGSGLSGNSTVTFSDNDPEVTAGNVDSVRISFSNCTIAVSGNLTVQIPVLPVAEGTATRVSVRGHLATSGTPYRYSRSTSIALGRAKVHAAPVTMSTSEEHTAVVSSIPEGALPGVFTVAPGRQVYFSKGNLQYYAPGGLSYNWRFAQNQYDYEGDWVTSGWVDLFGWGTWTGSNNPLTVSTDASDYSWDDNDFQGTIEGAPGPWRTLDTTEWNYLLDERSTTVRYAMATVNGVAGLIILPDDWSTTYHTLNSPNTANANYTTNNISSETWTSRLEAHGAVFLPAAGSRVVGEDEDEDGWYVYVDVLSPGNIGNYWLSTTLNDVQAYYVLFGNNNSNYVAADLLYCGASVRLVQDI